ncbi:hypothetical protein T265_06500 [Opisthorchis viverrini]|uniref:Uncharacterized protein n=1 Tax=Opisthorchis viverrini TaxID=6198 RepID=A0A074ZS93_OPIVI|nr:hypothetical protein T265_06500 [Opisthorchis viverrini]KER26220.1 hypothetical protein T265_06500 [Opisthorchis viverrini]
MASTIVRFPRETEDTSFKKCIWQGKLSVDDDEAGIVEYALTSLLFEKTSYYAGAIVLGRQRGVRLLRVPEKRKTTTYKNPDEHYRMTSSQELRYGVIDLNILLKKWRQDQRVANTDT